MRTRTLPTTCVSPGCLDPTVAGRRFCAPHAERLDGIRESVIAEGKKSIHPSGRPRGQKKRGSTCCNPACLEPRIPPAAYCAQCHSDGWTEAGE